MILLFAASSKAQDKEKVSTQYGDEWILVIDGEQYRAILPEHIKDIEKKEIELDSLKKQNDLLLQQISNLTSQIDLYKKTEDISNKQLALKEEINNQYRMIIKGQVDLLNGQKKLQPGKARAFFDKWYMQGLVKVVIPGVGLGWQVTHQH